jgi:uncharacterized UPF0146 family protein
MIRTKINASIPRINITGNNITNPNIKLLRIYKKIYSEPVPSPLKT